MGKNVQIPVELFEKLHLFTGWVRDSRLPEDPLFDEVDADFARLMQKVAGQLRKELDEKHEAMERREAFSAYKAHPKGSEERETRRQTYLDLAGVHKDWRGSEDCWDNEYL